jgi:predicted protein tyrosine phosphatase
MSLADSRADGGPALDYNSSWRSTSLDRLRLLFVCTANVDRSRTAEDLYAGDLRYEVRSAGVAPFATVPLTRELLLWADRVFVMSEREDRHETLIKMRFPEIDRPVTDLDIEDRWPRGHPDLVRQVLKKLAPHIGPPQKPPPGPRKAKRR